MQMTTCPTCEGRTYQICDQCRGSGESQSGQTICRACKGSGRVECETCWGDGEIEDKEIDETTPV